MRCVAVGGAVIVAGYFGINPPPFAAQVVAFAFALVASSFFSTIILGIFSKRMNKEGAISGMIAGIVFTVAYIVHAAGIGAGDHRRHSRPARRPSLRRICTEVISLKKIPLQVLAEGFS